MTNPIRARSADARVDQTDHGLIVVHQEAEAVTAAVGEIEVIDPNAVVAIAVLGVLLSEGRRDHGRGVDGRSEELSLHLVPLKDPDANRAVGLGHAKVVGRIGGRVDAEEVAQEEEGAVDDVVGGGSHTGNILQAERVVKRMGEKSFIHILSTMQPYYHAAPAA